MTPTFNSRDAESVASCVEYEHNRWHIDEATIPEDDDGLSEEDRYLTWQIRRIKRRWPGEFYPESDQATARFKEVQERWAAQRRSEQWKLEKPLIATAKYFVKRVVL